MNKQTQTKQEKKPTYTIQNCSIVNSSAANEHTRASVIALADAVTANANAIAAIANALKGSPATIERGISIGDGS